MAVSDTVVGALIGSGAALAAGAMAGKFGLIAEKRRRTWEDGNRWKEAKRRAYVDFLYTARSAHETVEALAGSRIKELEAQRGQTPFDGAELPNLAEEVRRQYARLDKWGERLEEATAAIFLMSSGPVRRAAEAHEDAWKRLNEAKSLIESASPNEIETGVRALAEECAKSRVVFRNAALDELRLETPEKPPILWWRWWQREHDGTSRA